MNHENDDTPASLRLKKAEPQQKMMRHSDIRTTFNIYGDIVTDEMTTAGVRVAKLAFEGIRAQTEREGS